MIKVEDESKMHITFRLVNGETLTADIDSKDFKLDGEIVVINDPSALYMIPVSSIVYIRQDLTEKTEAKKEETTDDAGTDS